ncbi:polyprenyl synthetase family protein [Microbacterium sp. NC79]|uniref:polyprenyl synthetase family protein n=1 Tax=Microbacterium sp. NC79 TaxID=2851009 RepID=UPI001C2C45D8|nr:polyprenyl synthetase family protein [Microbacterium sp. NC79]MBV0895382.1 polyprenyl synthetase family protein [Microbacterium sp. NC79]
MTTMRERLRNPETVQTEITTRLHALMQAKSTQAAAHGSHFAELWALTSQAAQGGKLLRPRLVLGVFDGFRATAATNTHPRETAIDLAAAVELLHFAFLLHDDLIDEDLTRRGVPNLAGSLVTSVASTQLQGSDPGDETRRMHWARSSALLMGDLMLTLAHQVFARARVADPERSRMLDLLDTTVTETVAGEYIDVSLADAQITPTLPLVLDMTRMKTATYSFELPLRLGAIVAGAGALAEQRLGDVGRHLGIAFQLQDDLLSAFEQSERHGKDQFSDFREGKETALIACARLTNEWPLIERLMGPTNFSEESGRALQQLLHECGARDVIEAMVRDQIEIAENILTRDDHVIAPEVCQFLLALMARMVGRQS